MSEVSRIFHPEYVARFLVIEFKTNRSNSTLKILLKSNTAVYTATSDACCWREAVKSFFHLKIAEYAKKRTLTKG